MKLIEIGPNKFFNASYENIRNLCKRNKELEVDNKQLRELLERVLLEQLARHNDNQEQTISPELYVKIHTFLTKP